MCKLNSQGFHSRFFIRINRSIGDSFWNVLESSGEVRSDVATLIGNLDHLTQPVRS
jgi:hypothetical protein